MKINKLNIDTSWTLFLDRDGVINKRLMGDYIKTVEAFEFLPGVLNAIKELSDVFGITVIVTNQQGIGKGLMTDKDLNLIHSYLKKEVENSQGRIHEVYYAPQLAKENSAMRKPNIGMATKAKQDFPTINFNKSIMVGDTLSDMEFGKNAGMITVLVGDESDATHPKIDYSFEDLKTFSSHINDLIIKHD